MGDFEKIILLMVAAILLVAAARKTKIPYPIVLVVGGGILSFIPGLNFTYFDPNLVLTIVLPPILYYAAFWMPWREFKRNLREIFSLALGLVIATTIVVAVLFKWCFPQFSWPLAFAFGAIVSPPDAAAATTVLKRVSISRRLEVILEGESLVNDASALILYKIAVAALLSGTFSLLDAGLDFVQITFGGIAFGLVWGYLIQSFSRKYLEPILAAVFSFLIPYLTYLFADQLHVSAVLAVVITGLIGSKMVFNHQSSLRRVVGFATWDLFIIMLNCFIFILIGSQLDDITNLMGLEEIARCSLYAVVITLSMLVVRWGWITVKSSIRYLRTQKQPELVHKYRQILADGTILGYAGMRGIVSLTAALALPWSMADGSPLIGREYVIFMVFLVIMYTLLLPGLTFSKLLRWLQIEEKPQDNAAFDTRKSLARIAEEEIKRLHKTKNVDDAECDLLSNYFTSRYRIRELTSQALPSHLKLESARKKVLQEQRKALIHSWEVGHIDDKMLVLLERELDLEETQGLKAEL